MTHVAVIDIGKTNGKVALVDRETLEERAVLTRPNTVVQAAPWPHFELDGMWAFVLEALASFQKTYHVDAISVTAHGASIVLLDENGNLAAPMLDYEHTGPDVLRQAYGALRPDFAVTGSPHLAAGLNVGAQLHWMFSQDTGLHARTKTIVTYPQYWAYRLTGVAATDPTSLGCHTDLWCPHGATHSELVDRLGLADKLAPLRCPDDVLGPILPTVAVRTGLPESTPVVCGIHDSNASLVSHLMSRQSPFSVVSTGTWVIVMSIGGKRVALDPARDTLLNVDANGGPVASARFMGGREFDLATETYAPVPSDAQLNEIVGKGLMLMPSFVPDVGPFMGCKPVWMPDHAPVDPAIRQGVASFYAALVTAECLSLTGHQGDVIVEGPFADNRAFARMLAVATGSDVVCTEGQTGTSIGAALLVEGPACPIRNETRIKASEPPTVFNAYARAWGQEVLRHSLENPAM